MDKYFRVNNPHIDPNTGVWIWEYPYHHQKYKDELRKGAYSSDIDSYRDEWTTGQHEINIMNSNTEELIRESNKNNKLTNDIPK